MTHDGTKTSHVHEHTGLRSSRLFARHPALGIVMFLIGSVIFGALAYSLWTHDGAIAWDVTIAKTFRGAEMKAPWSLMENMLFGIFLGKEVVFLFGVIVALYFLHRRFWMELTMVLTGLGGGGLLWFLFSRLLDRPGPADHLDILPATATSFPSGPALMAVLCYGLLAYVLLPNLRSHFWKWTATLLCLLAIVIVGVSSLLFGAHYATDVIAGYALGMAWAGLVYTLGEKFFQGKTTGEAQVEKENALDGLRVPGWFKRWPIAGLALILLGSLSFAAIAYNIRSEGAVPQLDLAVYQELLASARAASPAVNDLMLFGFFVGKQAVQLIVLILSLYFLSRRTWLEFAILQISTQGGGLLKNLIIDWFARPRPPEQLGLIITGLPSFPSGHALGTMICYGFLLYLLIPKMPSPFWKWTLSLGMLLLVLFEGFSRIFHGNHYLTDVLAAYALGIVWLVLVCTVMEGIFIRGKMNRD